MDKNTLGITELMSWVRENQRNILSKQQGRVQQPTAFGSETEKDKPKLNLLGFLIVNNIYRLQVSK